MSNFAIGADGRSIDVNVQDQISQPIEFYLSQKLNNVVVTGATAKTRTINLEAGHGFIAGNYIEIHYNNNGVIRFLQKKVVAVTATSVTTGSFVDINLTPDVVVNAKRVNVDLSVDGSVSPVCFSLGPCCNQEWDVTRLIGQMILASPPDDGLFGDLDALTNGIFFGAENDLGQTYLVDVVENGEFRASAYDVSYQDRSSPAGGLYGLTFRKSFAGADKMGVAIRLSANANEEFVCYVQDNLSDINRFIIKIMGHVVEKRIEP